MIISREKYDKVNARNVDLAGQVRDLNKESRCLYTENKDLRFENEELKELLKRIEELATSNTYNNDKAVLGKIKEVISDYQSTNNF